MPTHDNVCDLAVQSLRTTSRDDVIAAFVGSLSTRHLPARSAFGSLVVLQGFARHDFVTSTVFSSGSCATCGLRSEVKSESLERVQNYPFQVQHTDIKYAAFDLSTFGDRDVCQPTDDDRRTLNAMFAAIRALPATAQLTELNKSLQGIIKSNKFERMILLETLGYAGILCPRDHQHYSNGFVTHDFANTHQPAEFFKREWAYPVRFWTGESGVNEENINDYFGAYL